MSVQNLALKSYFTLEGGEDPSDPQIMMLLGCGGKGATRWRPGPTFAPDLGSPHYLVPQILDPTPLTLTCSLARFPKKTQIPLGYTLGSPS